MTKVVVLGSAQDGGIPHAGCKKPCCKNVWNNISLYRYPSSLAAVCEELKLCWIFDATPDIKHQIHMLNAYNVKLAGIFLTHAHIGHFAGLTSLGLEIMNLKKIPVYVMPRMERFLLKSPFISSMIENNVFTLRSISEKHKSIIGPFKVDAFNVPHRNELSETVGFRIAGLNKSIIYLPDIDTWKNWEDRLFELIAENDYLFIDGTYFNKNEIKLRNINKIPHPEIKDTMKMLKSLNRKDRGKIYFTHFNHTNTAINRDSFDRKKVLDAGYKLLKEKKVFKI